MSNSVTGADFVSAVATETGKTKREVRDFIDVISGVVGNGISEGKTVTLPGIVRIGTRTRAERTVRNPANGETSVKPAHKVLKVTGLKPLRDSIPK
ncbi:MAG: HU family DNA-binding protein [Roseibium sp.]|uniref:HU family DNA-binding protein n=1 Tax=Roseibium sp. TaxID=1936156 RepID=UPI00329A5CC2